MEQANPSQYHQVTRRIAGSLQTAAQSATSSGNPSLASELSQLSTDFGSASRSGQLPKFRIWQRRFPVVTITVITAAVPLPRHRPLLAPAPIPRRQTRLKPGPPQIAF
jgi:hypothetical protein